MGEPVLEDLSRCHPGRSDAVINIFGHIRSPHTAHNHTHVGKCPVPAGRILALLHESSEVRVREIHRARSDPRILRDPLLDQAHRVKKVHTHVERRQRYRELCE